VLAGANSGCCGIYHEFYESCASKFIIAFKADMLLISWLKDSCAVPTATPSKPLPSPPNVPTPIFTFDGETFPLSTFEPPEIPLPKLLLKVF
jgi:hypothetical protein